MVTIFGANVKRTLDEKGEWVPMPDVGVSNLYATSDRCPFLFVTHGPVRSSQVKLESSIDLFAVDSLFILFRMILYFAYGSNLCYTRMLSRVPSAAVLSVGCLQGFDISFSKKGIDGSGKCTISEVGGHDALVFGVVYMLDDDEKASLDLAETVGTGYDEIIVPVTTPVGTLDAFTYVARVSHVDDTLQPFGWYLDFVLEGARHHRLPEYYVSRILSVNALADPDPARTAMNHALLAAA